MSDPVYRIPPDWSVTEVTTPMSEVQDWSLDFLGIPELWRQNKGQVNGEPIVVGVIDTGIDDRHEDLQDAILDARDFTNSPIGYNDKVRHGSWVGGYIAARAHNNVGVRGIAPESKLLVAKALNDLGAGTDGTIGAAMEWVISRGARFINLSLGGPRMSRWLHAKFIEAARAGIFCFAASGNDSGPVNAPGHWPETIAVGAVDKDGNLTRFTSRGPSLDILAPGVDMLSTVPGGYGVSTGTSMACPAACAVGMLAYGKHEEKGGESDLKTVVQMREHLKRTADPVNGGPGLIDPDELLGEHDDTPGSRWEFKLGPVVFKFPAAEGDTIGMAIEEP